jgi:hypothetical protein
MLHHAITQKDTRTVVVTAAGGAGGGGVSADGNLVNGDFGRWLTSGFGLHLVDAGWSLFRANCNSA